MPDSLSKSLLISFGLLAPGCATPQAKQDQTSAAEHRREAAQDQRAANIERSEYDPNASATLPTTLPVPSPGATDDVLPDATYNPTHWHLTQAQRDSEHAKAHQKEAAELDAFMARECGTIPPAARAACPTLGPVVKVTDVGGGVRLDYAQGTDLNPYVSHMRCHLAFARDHAFNGGNECPLYLRGVDIRLSKDGRAVELVSSDKGVSDELRRRSHMLAPTDGTPPPATVF